MTPDTNVYNQIKLQNIILHFQVTSLYVSLTLYRVLGHLRNSIIMKIWNLQACSVAVYLTALLEYIDFYQVFKSKSFPDS